MKKIITTATLLLTTIAPVHAQEVLSDYYLQELMKLNGQGGSSQTTTTTITIPKASQPTISSPVVREIKDNGCGQALSEAYTLQSIVETRVSLEAQWRANGLTVSSHVAHKAKGFNTAMTMLRNSCSRNLAGSTISSRLRILNSKFNEVEKAMEHAIRN